MNSALPSIRPRSYLAARWVARRLARYVARLLAVVILIHAVLTFSAEQAEDALARLPLVAVFARTGRRREELSDPDDDGRLGVSLTSSAPQTLRPLSRSGDCAGVAVGSGAGEP